MVLLLVFLLVFYSIILMRSTDLLINGLRHLSTSLQVGKYGLTAFFLALATSLPELFVGIAAALGGQPELSLGNVIGSNIANLSLVLGGAAVIAGKIKASDKFLDSEVFHTFLAGALPFILLLDKNLGPIDGLLLLFVYVLYNLTVLRSGRREIAQKQLGKGRWFHRVWLRMSSKGTGKSFGTVILGIALLIFSAQMLVLVTSRLSDLLNLPLLFVGLVILAIGTSLPELSFEIAAVRKGESQMALGNILGSIVANSTLILGITVIISPITLADGLITYFVATLAFVLIFGLFWLYVRSEKKLERWEGAILLIMFVIFVWSEIIRKV